MTTLAAAAHPSAVRAFAASAGAVAQGQIWRLVTSGMLAERPIAASLVSFTLLAGLVLVLCGRRVYWLAAVCGHVGSAVRVYLLIEAGRLLRPGQFQAALWSRDYGVSAISAAWLGAVAASGWLRRGPANGAVG